MDASVVKIDLWRLKAKFRINPGGTFPAAFVSVLRLKNASFSWADKSFVPTSVRGCLGIAEIAQKMRRVSGPFGGSGRQDVLYVAEDEEVFPGEGNFEERSASRNATKELEKRRTGL